MLSRKYLLEVNPLKITDLRDIDALDVQIKDVMVTRQFFKAHGLPAHQATFTDEKGVIVLLAGWLELGPKHYEGWTIFSKSWNRRCYPFFREWVHEYFGLLQAKSVSHIISDDRPWMKQVLGYLGFIEGERDGDAGVEWVMQ